jgi:hypothetical protein
MDKTCSTPGRLKEFIFFFYLKVSREGANLEDNIEIGVKGNRLQRCEMD